MLEVAEMAVCCPQCAAPALEACRNGKRSKLCVCDERMGLYEEATKHSCPGCGVGPEEPCSSADLRYCPSRVEKALRMLTQGIEDFFRSDGTVRPATPVEQHIEDTLNGLKGWKPLPESEQDKAFREGYEKAEKARKQAVPEPKTVEFPNGLRHFKWDAGGNVTVTDTDLDGFEWQRRTVTVGGTYPPPHEELLRRPTQPEDQQDIDLWSCEYEMSLRFPTKRRKR